MKKKYTKKQFYKRLAYQKMAQIQKAFDEVNRAFGDQIELVSNIQKLKDLKREQLQRQYEQQQEALASGKAWVLSADRPKQSADLSKLICENIQVTIH